MSAPATDGCAAAARAAGLEPLADRLFADPALAPLEAAADHIDAAAGYADAAAVLDGVRDILAERWAEDAVLVAGLRDWLWQTAQLRSTLRAGCVAESAEAARFRDYFDYAEPICRVPSHRALAVFRGRAQDVLDIRLQGADEAARAAAPPGTPGEAEGRIASHLSWRHAQRAGDELIRKCVAWAWKVKLAPRLERELFGRMRKAAEQVAIKVFAANLRGPLLAAPDGPRAVMGLDPGIRTGCKVAVVDATGKLLATETVYPLEPRRDWEGALHRLGLLCAAHAVDLIAIGNGTASRETDRLAGELVQRVQKAAPGVRLDKVVLSEAGALVYSASEYASRELPELDVSLRGAVSIARPLQDPLAELVKIEPKSIGVGQYQHDLDPTQLARSLDAVVEDCVNAVGVDLNTASAPLLARVSGLSGTLASGIVRWRDAHGAFRGQRQLLEVKGLGAKTFEQSAGFLRISGGDDPLDASGVHPESYPLVARLLAALHRRAADVIGRRELIRTLKPEAFADAQVGVVTVADILVELEKPGRDPRPAFKVARLAAGIEDIKHLKVGITLEGTVSNVAQFGAFVDPGVHQDGLVHVSQLADRRVADAREVVKTGDIVRVRVPEVDLTRKRIALSMKSAASDARPASGRGAAGAGADQRFPPATRLERAAAGSRGANQPASAMAAALAKAQSRR